MSVAMNEQETVIRFGRDSEECEIYTSDTTVMTKLDKLASKNNDKAPLWKLKEEHRTKATHELVLSHMIWDFRTTIVLDVSREACGTGIRSANISRKYSRQWPNWKEKSVIVVSTVSSSMN